MYYITFYCNFKACKSKLLLNNCTAISLQILLITRVALYYFNDYFAISLQILLITRLQWLHCNIFTNSVNYKSAMCRVRSSPVWPGGSCRRSTTCPWGGSQESGGVLGQRAWTSPSPAYPGCPLEWAKHWRSSGLDVLLATLLHSQKLLHFTVYL